MPQRACVYTVYRLSFSCEFVSNKVTRLTNTIKPITWYIHILLIFSLLMPIRKVKVYCMQLQDQTSYGK